MRPAICVLSFAILALLSPAASAAEAEVDVPFLQETHTGYPFPLATECPITSVALHENYLAVGTECGVYGLDLASGEYIEGKFKTPIFDLDTTIDGGLMIADMDGLVSLDGPKEKRQDWDGAIAVSAQREIDGRSHAVALGPKGMWHDRGRGFRKQDLPSSRALREAVIDAEGGVWIATGMGLTHYRDRATRLYQHVDEIVSSDVRGVAIDGQGRVWAGSFGGITIYADGEEVQRLTPADGLPTVDLQCLAWGPNGRMWIGTSHGVTRYDGTKWSTLFSRRWLLDDDVRDIAFDADGTAWVATRTGISAIKRTMMTMAEKAAYFHAVSEARHVRPPGVEEKVYLQTPGDLSTWRPEDDDNDGGYTACHIVMEAHRYAATGDPEAKARAKRGFDFLHFLEEVDGVPGFFARTVIPADWDHMHDPNRTYTDEEKALSAVREPRYKPVEIRWHPTADGKWLWKGDTSSDEVTSHFYAFHYYHDLVADDEEKKRVAALAARIMDHIIDGGYVFRDIDGEHTRWGVWAPKRLNHDPEWRAERGINSLEILSYLKATYHMTGDKKYEREYQKLLHKHGYKENVRHAKTFAVAWQTHIDDELLSQVYPALFKYETDPELLALYRESLDHWYEGIRNEYNPYFNYSYAMLSDNEQQHEDSIFFLRDAPLDLINWRIDQSWREDLEIVRSPILEERSMSRLVPPSERATVRWDKNPWMIARGDGGRTEWSPTFWLLPYWMGRYYGYIAAP